MIDVDRARELAATAAEGETAAVARASVGFNPPEREVDDRPMITSWGDVLLRPSWHAEASCRGIAMEALCPDGRSAAASDRVIEVAGCRTCTVAGRCLEEAMNLPHLQRRFGPIRGGVLNGRRWRLAERVVAMVEPETPEHWQALARAFASGSLQTVGRQTVRQAKEAAA